MDGNPVKRKRSELNRGRKNPFTYIKVLQLIAREAHVYYLEVSNYWQKYKIQRQWFSVAKAKHSNTRTIKTIVNLHQHDLLLY